MYLANYKNKYYYFGNLIMVCNETNINKIIKDQSNHITSSNNYDKSSYHTSINRGHIHQVIGKKKKKEEEVQLKRYWRKFFQQKQSIPKNLRYSK